MTSQISLLIRNRILVSWFKGLSRAEVALQVGKAHGTVGNVVKQFKSEFSNDSDAGYNYSEELGGLVSDLRDLSVGLKRAGCSVEAAKVGAKLHARLKELIDPEKIEGFISLGEKFSTPKYPPSALIPCAERLLAFEERTKSRFAIILTVNLKYGS